MPAKKAYFFALTAFVFLVDRITKVCMVCVLSGAQEKSVIPNLFSLRLVYNSGTAFGMFKDSTRALVGLSTVFVAVIAASYLSHFYKKGLLVFLAMSLLAGGALGNLYDRVRYGFVVDFIDCKFWSVFNVADICITIGAALAFIYFARRKEA